MIDSIFKDAIQLYITKKLYGRAALKKALTSRYIDKLNNFNEALDLLFFDNIVPEYDDNHRNGLYIDYIISPSKNTESIYYSFRGREIITYHLQTKKIVFSKEEYNMCMFTNDDFKIMSLFLKNCLKDIQKDGVDLESYEIN